MNEAETTAYLGNILAVIAVDGSLSRSEELFLEAVRTRIGASKTSLKKARQAAGVSQIAMNNFARFSDRAQNLEDMIEAAMLDNQLSAEEKSLLGRAARDAGLTQQQVDLMLAEAKRRVPSCGQPCPNCGNEVGPQAKFCSSCGNMMGPPDTPTTAVAFKVPDSGLFVAFAKSTAAAFPLAMDEARKSPSFQEIEREGKTWYGVSYAMAELSAATKIASALSPMRNKKVFLDGKEQEWSNVFAFAWCAEQRNQAFNGVEHCFGLADGRFNPWGCKQLDLNWVGWSEWFTWGRFVDARTFEFDFDRIRHAIETTLLGVRLCPHIRLKFIEAVFKALPKRAQIGPEWSYRQAYQADPRAITVQVHQFGFEQTIHAIGVEPTAGAAVREIIVKALKSCHQADLSLSALRLDPG